MKTFRAVPGFKVFAASTAEELEQAMNTWLRTIPRDVQVKRAELAATESGSLFALVNYVTAIPSKDEA